MPRFPHGIKHFFTLIEMMVVLTIIAVISSLAAPRLGRFYQGLTLDSTARRFRLFLDTARAQAALNQTVCRVVIQPGWRRVDMEILRPDYINSPGEAVKFIERLKSGRIPPGDEKFEALDGAMSYMELPAGVSLKHVSVSGGRQSPASRVVITFDRLNQADEINFVFENGLRDFSGLQLAAGGGMARDLRVIDEDKQDVH